MPWECLRFTSCEDHDALSGDDPNVLYYRRSQRGIAKMDRRFAMASGFAVFISLMSAAKAANLEITQGDVLLSQGTGYRAVRNSMELQVGDTVVSKPGSAAEITFADGCSVHLRMGMMFTVEEESPCGAGAAAKGSQANTDALNSADSWKAGTTTSAATDDAQMNIWPYVLGAAVVGGVAAAASTLGGDNSGSPVSP